MTKTHRWVLAGILLVALALRVWGVAFGLPHAHARPDETSVAGPAVSFLSGQFEPPHFLYPTGFMYGLAGAYVAYYEVTRPWAPYKTLHEFAESRRQSLAPFLLVSRGISVAFGVLGVLWLYLLGSRVAGRREGLLAAAFLAVAFLAVRDAHFGVTDTTMSALVVLGVYYIARWHDAGTLPLAAHAGVVSGLAMGMKYNGLGLALPFAVAAADRIAKHLGSRSGIAKTVVGGALFVLLFAAVFCASTFYLFIQPDRFLSDVTMQKGLFEAGHGIVMPIGWQFHATTTLPLALGWPLYIAGLAGVIWWFARDPRRAAVTFAFPLAFYIVAGQGHTVFARYMLPVVPFVCLGAGWLCARFVDIVAESATPARRRAVFAVLFVLVAAPTLGKSIQIDRLLARTDNRVFAAAAMPSFVSPGSTIYLPGDLTAKLQPPSELNLHQVDTAEGADWIVVPKSPLVVYSAMPPGLNELLAQKYELVRSFPVGDDRPRVYDQQDAFYLPLAGFDGLDRPGPAFDFYRKK